MANMGSHETGIISLFIGQAGVQIGNAFWELMCVEHGLNTEGEMKDSPVPLENPLSFFIQISDNRYIPRSLFIDLEPSVISETRTGCYRKLYHPDTLISGKEDSGGNFARGFFTVGRLLIDTVTDQLRRTLEINNGDSMRGLVIFRSLGGGTGSGLTSALLDSVIDSTMLAKVTRIEVPVYPSPLITGTIVEPYNALLSEHFCMEDLHLGLLFDNESLYEICGNNLDPGARQPTFTTINRILAHAFSGITASLRFENVLNCDLNVLQTNLVPYPRIHFPICNYAPIVSSAKLGYNKLSVGDITNLIFDSSHQLIKVDPLHSKLMSCTLFYRGNISPYEVYAALRQIKNDKRIQFVDWCPTGFKVSICRPALLSSEDGSPREWHGLGKSTRAVSSLMNCSAVSKAWCRLASRFQLLYVKRAFLHWFVSEGLEEIEFNEANMNIASLIQDYAEAADDPLAIVCSAIKRPDKEDPVTENESLIDMAASENNKPIHRRSFAAVHDLPSFDSVDENDNANTYVSKEESYNLTTSSTVIPSTRNQYHNYYALDQRVNSSASNNIKKPSPLPRSMSTCSKSTYISIHHHITPALSVYATKHSEDSFENRPSVKDRRFNNNNNIDDELLSNASHSTLSSSFCRPTPKPRCRSVLE